MLFSSQHISVVIQGPIYSQYNIEDHVITMRKILPESEFILSSDTIYIDKNSLFDHIIYNKDINTLPPLKFNQQSKNNINKQIYSSLLGIKKSSRPLILKIRTDQFLSDVIFLEIWNHLKELDRKILVGKGRILTTSLYTLNPNSYERMAYHISDMLLFGYKEDIERFFSCPKYEYEDAIWYEYNKHALHSNKIEKTFRSRFAVEQWLTLNYIFKNKNFPIKYHNDISKKIINQFENFLVDTFIIVHPRDICLSMPKFTRDYNSFTANLTCYSTNDYKKLLKTKRNLDFKITIKKNFPHHTLTRLFLQLTTKNSYMFKKIIKLISFFKRN